jgi:hypothetical protein
VITCIRADALARVSLARVAVVTGMFISSSWEAFARSAVFTCAAAGPGHEERRGEQRRPRRTYARHAALAEQKNATHAMPVRPRPLRWSRRRPAKLVRFGHIPRVRRRNRPSAAFRCDIRRKNGMSCPSPLLVRPNMTDSWKRFGVFSLVLAASVGPLLAQTANDKELTDRSNALLVTYATFKNYPSKDPAVVYKNLSPDRRAVFDAIVRALFVRIQDDDGNPGKRVIDFVEEVRGIWGVRPKQKEGRHMFRISLRFSASMRDTLKKSSNLPGSTKGHVLLPMQKGGDDDPAFTGFATLLKTSDIQTFREASKEPKLQISVLKNDPAIGEVDIDYDGFTILCGCHCKPSNSDVGSRKSAPDKHLHLTAFNVDVPFFTAPLAPAWSNSAAHCKDMY